MRRLILPLVFGLAGVAVLLALGTWQLQRLAWKTALIDEIEGRIAAAPVALPPAPDANADRFLPVMVRGSFLPGEIHVLTSRKILGAGFRIVAPFETENGRRILVDRGFVPQEAKEAARPLPEPPVTVVGNLHWPIERDAFTPENDRDRNFWFARDVAPMAHALGTEPVLLVTREAPGTGIEPFPIGTEGIPNDHLEYAMTWFGLAIIWAGMTLLWLWRIRRRDG